MRPPSPIQSFKPTEKNNRTANVRDESTFVNPLRRHTGYFVTSGNNPSGKCFHASKRVEKKAVKQFFVGTFSFSRKLYLKICPSIPGKIELEHYVEYQDILNDVYSKP